MSEADLEDREGARAPPFCAPNRFLKICNSGLRGWGGGTRPSLLCSYVTIFHISYYNISAPSFLKGWICRFKVECGHLFQKYPLHVPPGPCFVQPEYEASL